MIIAKYLRDPDQGVEGLTPLAGNQQIVMNSDNPKDNGLFTLFAVTQDIEVGDEVHFNGSNHIFLGFIGQGQLIALEGIDNYVNRNTLCKILGPLSPNATWVKDGDEIDGRLVPENYVGDGTKKRKVKSVFQVKGPCGHYH